MPKIRCVKAISRWYIGYDGQNVPLLSRITGKYARRGWRSSADRAALSCRQLRKKQSALEALMRWARTLRRPLCIVELMPRKIQVMRRVWTTLWVNEMHGGCLWYRTLFPPQHIIGSSQVIYSSTPILRRATFTMKFYLFFPHFNAFRDEHLSTLPALYLMRAARRNFSVMIDAETLLHSFTRWYRCRHYFPGAMESAWDWDEAGNEIRHWFSSLEDCFKRDTPRCVSDILMTISRWLRPEPRHSFRYLKAIIYLYDEKLGTQREYGCADMVRRIYRYGQFSAKNDFTYRGHSLRRKFRDDAPHNYYANSLSPLLHS